MENAFTETDSLKGRRSIERTSLKKCSRFDYFSILNSVLYLQGIIVNRIHSVDYLYNFVPVGVTEDVAC